MDSAKAKYQQAFRSPFKIWMFFMSKLPSLAWWGVRIKSIDDEACIATIPFTWRTQNPFRSIYFAAQAGAAEISTGVLVQAAFQGRGSWSMLVTECRSEFTAKATTKIEFKCEDGQRLADLIDEIERVGEPRKIELVSTGRDTTGKIVSKFYLTWSLKKRDKK